MIPLSSSAYLVLALLVIAAVVAVGLMRKKNMWPLIVLYWVTLTVKNLIDWLGVPK